MDRREMLRRAGQLGSIGLVGGLAGCTTGSTTPAADGSETPTPTAGPATTPSGDSDGPTATTGGARFETTVQFHGIKASYLGYATADYIVVNGTTLDPADGEYIGDYVLLIHARAEVVADSNKFLPGIEEFTIFLPDSVDADKSSGIGIDADSFTATGTTYPTYSIDPAGEKPPGTTVDGWLAFGIPSGARLQRDDLTLLLVIDSKWHKFRVQTGKLISPE